jgi:hypothetical protein
MRAIETAVLVFLLTLPMTVIGQAVEPQSIYYDSGHKFDLKMQADAFAWFDLFLKTPLAEQQASR